MFKRIWRTVKGWFTSSAEPTDAELEKQADEAAAELKKTFPLEKYVKLYGPLHWEQWRNRLHKDPAAQEQLTRLVEHVERPPDRSKRQEYKTQLLEMIQSQPDLKRRVESEYRVQKAHMIRGMVYGNNLLAPKVKSEEWNALHARIEDVLGHHGKIDAFGEGDYLLVDDEMGEAAHKIEVHKPDALTTELIKKLQSLLKGWKNEWAIIVQFEFDEVTPDLDAGMLVIWADWIDEIYDKAHYREVLSSRFKL